jgi:hypothetical protein
VRHQYNRFSGGLKVNRYGTYSNPVGTDKQLLTTADQTVALTIYDTSPISVVEIATLCRRGLVLCPNKWSFNAERAVSG